jgi:isoleucyl-tRNA synthetase
LLSQESLLEFVSKEMKAYRLYTVVPRLTKFIDQLTNWYVRMNRKRIKGEMGMADCLQSIDTLFNVLMTMVKMMAPFTPFLTEFMYLRLRMLDDTAASATSLEGSIHQQMMPVPKRGFIRLDIERAVSRMQAVVELGRVMRDRRNVPIKYPLPELVVIHQDPEYLKDVLSLEAFILGELNVRVLTPSSDKLKYGVTVRAEPDHKVLGQRLKNDFKQITQLIKKLTDSEIQQQLARGHFEIGGHRIETNEIRIIIQFEAGDNDGLSQRYEAHSDNDVLVLMDMTPNQELQEEGMAREIINRVQKLKKKAKLIPTDPVLIYFKIGNDSNDVLKVAHSHRQFIETIIKSPFLDDCAEAQSKSVLIEETQELKSAQFTIRICSTQEQTLPFGTWVNVVLLASSLPARFVPQQQVASEFLLGSVLLQRPSTGALISLDELRQEISLLFGLHARRFQLLDGEQKPVEAVSSSLSGKTLMVTHPDAKMGDIKNVPQSSAPFSKFVNAEANGVKRTVFIENPTKCNVLAKENVNELLKQFYPTVKAVDSIAVKYSCLN